MHPAARAVGGARAKERGPALAAAPALAPAPADTTVADEALGVSSLARALSGEANVADAGALSWMMIRQMLPCTSMGLYLPDEAHDTVVGSYAAGSHAPLLRSLRTCPGNGIVGWVAGHRRTAVNAEPALDFGAGAGRLEPPLLSALAVPLVHDGAMVAVLCVYAPTRQAFSDDHARLLELLAPRLAMSIAAVSGRVCAAFEAPRAAAVRGRPPSELTLLKGPAARRATG
jgi:putative methionine-R-sulfoxide reductase with GAF domain